MYIRLAQVDCLKQLAGYFRQIGYGRWIHNTEFMRFHSVCCCLTTTRRTSHALSVHSAGVTEWRSISSVDQLSSSEAHLSQKTAGARLKKKKGKIVLSAAQWSLNSLMQCNGPLCPGDENCGKASEIMLYSIILLRTEKAVWHQATWLQGLVTVMSRQQEQKMSWER